MGDQPLWAAPTASPPPAHQIPTQGGTNLKTTANLDLEIFDKLDSSDFSKMGEV